MITFLGNLHEDILQSGNQAAKKYSLNKLKVGRKKKIVPVK